MKLAIKLNAGSTQDCPCYADEIQGPLKPGFHFYKWLSSGPSLQVPIPQMMIADETSPIKYVFTNSKGFVESHTLVVTNQSERDRFMTTYLDRFITHSSANNSVQSLDPVYNRTVAVARYPMYDNKVGDVNHLNQRTEVLTPLTVQSLLQRAIDNNLESCVLQQFVRCRATHANFYRIVYRSTSIDSGTVIGYNIANLNTDYKTIDMITTLSKDDQQPAVDNSTTKGKAKSTIQCNYEITNDTEQNANHAQHDLLFRRRATRIIAHYISAALKHERGELHMHTDPVVKLNHKNKNVITSRPSMVKFNNTADNNNDHSPSSLKTTTAARRSFTDTQKSNVQFAALTIDTLSANNESRRNSNHSPQRSPQSPTNNNNTFLTDTKDSSNNRQSPTASSRSPKRRKALAKLLRSDTTLTFTSEKASSEAQHQSQLHRHLDVFREKSNEELSRLFTLGLSLNLHMSLADREEATVIGKYVHEQVGLRHNLCSMTDAHHNLTDASLKALTVTRVSEHALEVVKQYTMRIAKWLQAVLLSHHKLPVQFEELVCDFVRDENNNFYFTSLKGFRITQESQQKVRLWHEKSVLGFSLHDSTNDRVVSNQEWRVKQTSLAATECKLCGQQYNPSDTTSVPAPKTYKRGLNAVDTFAVVTSADKMKTFNAQSESRPLSAASRVMPHNSLDIDMYIEAQTALLFARRNAINDKYTASPTKSRLVPVITPLSTELTAAQESFLEGNTAVAGAKTEVPSLGYKLTTQGAVQLVTIYHAHRLPLTTYGRGLLDAAVDQQSGSSEGARRKKAQSLEDCCYSCFHIYRQHKDMRKRLMLLMKYVHNDKRFEDSIVQCLGSSDDEDEEGESHKKSRPKSASRSRTMSPDVRFSFEGFPLETPPVPTPLNSVVPIHTVYSGVAGIVRARPKSAGSLRRPLSASSGRLPTQLSLALAESEKQIGITMQPHKVSKRPPSAQSVRSAVSFQGDVQSQRQEFSPSQERVVVPVLHAVTLKTKVLSGAERKVDALHRHVDRRNVLEHAQLMAANRLGGLSRGDRLPTATLIPEGASHFRMLVMLHYFIPEHQLTSRGGGDLTGCISYSLGQTQHKMNFSHCPDKEGSSRNNLVWIRQCRMHYLVGTAKDAETLFETKKIEFKIHIYNEQMRKKAPVTIIKAAQTVKTSQQPKVQVHNIANISTNNTPFNTSSAICHTTSADSTRDYEITKCIPMMIGDDDHSGDSNTQDSKEEEQRVEDKSTTADGTSSEALSVLVEEVEDEDSSKDGDGLSAASGTQGDRQKVLLDGSFVISLEQLRWTGASVSQGTEKIDLFAPVTLRSMGEVTVKLSVAVVRDDAPLPAALSMVRSGFVIEQGVFWPPHTYTDAHFPLPEPWLSMLTEKPSDAAYDAVQQADLLLAGSGEEKNTIADVFNFGQTPTLTRSNTAASCLVSKPSSPSARNSVRLSFAGAFPSSETSSMDITSSSTRPQLTPPRPVRQSFMNSSATTAIRQSFGGVNSALTRQQSLSGMRRSFVGQLYSALEQFNAPLPTSEGESPMSDRPSEAASVASSSQGDHSPAHNKQRRGSIFEVLDRRDSSIGSPQKNTFIDRYEHEVAQQKDNKLSVEHMAELDYLCVQFEQVVSSEISRQDAAAIVNSRKAQQVMQHSTEFTPAEGDIIASIANSFNVPPISIVQPRRASALLSHIAKRNALSIVITPTHAESSAMEEMRKPSEMVSDDLDENDDESDGDEERGNAAPSQKLTPTAVVASPTAVPGTPSSSAKNLFRKVFGSIISANRRKSLALSPLGRTFESVLDSAVVDFHHEGVLSRHMGVMRSKEAVTLLSARLNELRAKQTLNVENAVQVSSYILDLMNMTLKHMFVLDYLPERVNWVLLKPLLLEVLYGLIVGADGQ